MQQRDTARGLIIGGMAGTLAGTLSTLLLSKPVLAAPEDSKEVLTYLINLGELQAQALARLVEIAETYPGVPGLPSVADPRIRALLRAQFMSDPDAVCSLINSHQSNLVRGAPLATNIVLAPLASITLSTVITAGFTHVFTTLDFFTDIPFAVNGTILLDGHLWYFDTGLCPVSYRFKNWLGSCSSQWQVILTNTSAFLNVNLHAYFGGWDIEAQTFNRLKSAVKPLSYALAEYGSPDGGTE